MRADHLAARAPRSSWCTPIRRPMAPSRASNARCQAGGPRIATQPQAVAEFRAARAPARRGRRRPMENGERQGEPGPGPPRDAAKSFYGPLGAPGTAVFICALEGRGTLDQIGVGGLFHFGDDKRPHLFVLDAQGKQFRDEVQRNDVVPGRLRPTVRVQVIADNFRLLRRADVFFVAQDHFVVAVPVDGHGEGRVADFGVVEQRRAPGGSLPMTRRRSTQPPRPGAAAAIPPRSIRWRRIIMGGIVTCVGAACHAKRRGPVAGCCVPFRTVLPPAGEFRCFCVRWGPSI